VTLARSRKKPLSQQDLRAAGVTAGVTPGLMVRRYDADGRARRTLSTVGRGVGS
jgi:hypothetical protein